MTGLGYPEIAVLRLGWDRHEVLDDDLDLIAQPLDVLGVNYYTRQVVRAGDAVVEDARHRRQRWAGRSTRRSFGELLRDLHERYRFPRYLVTENGAAMPDAERRDGRIDDRDRIAYVADHVAGLHGALGAGVPIDGYFVWSLLDNFEWAHGYTPRFGIVEVVPQPSIASPRPAPTGTANCAAPARCDPSTTTRVVSVGSQRNKRRQRGATRSLAVHQTGRAGSLAPNSSGETDSASEDSISNVT